MEDDMNQDMGRVPGEDWVGVWGGCMLWTMKRHLIGFTLFFPVSLVFHLYISTSPAALDRSPRAQVTPYRMNIKNVNPFIKLQLISDKLKLGRSGVQTLENKEIRLCGRQDSMCQECHLRRKSGGCRKPITATKTEEVGRGVTLSTHVTYKLIITKSVICVALAL